MPPTDPQEAQLQHERHELLHHLTEWLETPMLVLGFGWLVLLGVELIWGSRRRWSCSARLSG